MKLRTLSLATVVLGYGAPATSLIAQGTDLGTIRGTVTDPSGAQIPQAQVEVTDLSTGISRSFKTGDHGTFEAAALPSGHYKVTISSPGFGTSTLEGLTLNGSDSVSANATLQLRAETSVDVSGDASIINTEDSTLSQTLTPTAIIELPRDSRGYLSIPLHQPQRNPERHLGRLQISRWPELWCKLLGRRAALEWRDLRPGDSKRTVVGVGR